VQAGREVVVVGAGPAGLARAFWHRRQHPGDRVTVLEAGSTPGGWVRSERVDGYLCEHGPQAVRPSGELDALATALGAGAELVAADARARHRWLGRGGRLLAVPGSPGQLLATPLLPVLAKLRLLGERFVRRAPMDSESVAAFARRRFGPRVVPLVQTMVGGIFAGDAERLEVGSAFPLLATAEREHGSVLRGLAAARRGRTPAARRASLYSFRGGMATLCARLAGALGERLRTRSRVNAVERDGARFAVVVDGGERLPADLLVLACPARAAAALLEGLDRELAAELAAIPFASLASVWLGGPLHWPLRSPPAAPPPTMRGFGFLLEPGEPGPALGAIYCSELFADHAPPGCALLRVMLGGVRHPGAVDLADDALVAAAEAAVRRYAGASGPWPFRRVVRARAAIPQYELGHGARIARIEQRLAQHLGLRLCGNSYRGVALTAQLAADGAGLPASEPAHASISP
jgi:oxygen-dependent protoporphyrinogen oxidase